MYAIRNGPKVVSGASFVNPDFFAGKARLVIITGGCFQIVAHYPEVAGADVVVYIDVTDEIAAAKPPAAVKVVALAQGESLATLLRSVKASQDLQEFMKEHPGVLLSTGLGQIRKLGQLAAQKVLQDPNFDEWINGAVFEPLLLRHNGMLKEIEISVLSSTPGGTGSGAARCLGEAVKNFLVARTPALVHLVNVRIGCLAFTGLGTRTRSNAAQALPEDIGFTLARDRDDQEIRELVLAELPMDGEDKELRDERAAQFVRSLRTQSVRSTRDRGAINATLTSPLGAVTVVRSGFYNAIPNRLIAGQTCAKVLPPVAGLLATPADIEAVREVRLVLKPDSSNVLSIDDLMGLARRSPKIMPENFVNLCLKTPSYDLRAYVVLRGDTTLEAGSDFERMLRQVCQVPDDYRRLLGICGGTLRRNEEVAAVETRELKALQPAILQAKRAFNIALSRIYPQRIWQEVSKAFSNPAAGEQRLQNAIQRVRELLDKAQQLEVKINGRQWIRELVQSERDRICRPLRRLLAVLEGHRPVAGEHHVPLVTVADDSFIRILPNLESCESDRDVLSLLVGCVRQVTAAGLARIVGASSDDIQSIVRALASNDPPTLAPWWGRAEPTGARQAIFVLPPIPTSLEDDLRGVIQRDWDGQLQLATAGTAAGGLNVVRMEYVKPDRMSCLDTPLLATTRQKEVEPQSYLFNTSGNGELDRFGELTAMDARRVCVR
jgi:uncharacterized protein YlxP (DUF503 family)